MLVLSLQDSQCLAFYSKQIKCLTLSGSVTYYCDILISLIIPTYIPYGLGVKCPCAETGYKIPEETLTWGITYIYNLYLYTTLHSLTYSLCILNYCWSCNCNEFLWASFLFPFTLCHYSHVVTGDDIFCNDERACVSSRGSLSPRALCGALYVTLRRAR